MSGKEKAVGTRICGEMSRNQILARFVFVQSPPESLSVLYFPFRAVIPSAAV
jgi:hypothetical protein